jgi:hypothetical protein
MSINLKEYTDEVKRQNPIETKVVHKIYKALRDAGDPITHVYDGDEDTDVTTMASMDLIVFNLDECFLNTRSGGWVRIVMGNDWDCLVDYTLNLEDALQPVNDYIDKHN